MIEELSGMDLNPIPAGHAVFAPHLDSRFQPSESDSAADKGSDFEAVDRVLTGNAQAFAQIVQRWQGPLVNMAWRYCRDRGRAEELAQGAFVRAWRGLSGWRREGSFST